MKKTLVALATLAVVSAASAQSTVTLYGLVDLGYSFGNGSIANKAAMVEGNSSSSRLGFKGVEDLGGGLAANFQLEAGMTPNSGAGYTTNSNNQLSGIGANSATVNAGSQGLTFNRISTVGLSGNFGQVKLGHDYTPVFDIDGGFDPFAFNGVGATLSKVTATLAGATEVRASNSIAYDIAVSGFQARVMYGLGQNASNATNNNDGNYAAWRIGYAQGPVNVQLAASRLNATVATTAFSAATAPLGAIPGDVTEIAFGASYDLGKIKPMFTYNKTNNDSANVTTSNYLLGLSAPIGAGSLLASYNRGSMTSAGATVGTIDKLAVGYVYNMSKRTAVYGTLATLRNADGAAVGLNGAVTDINTHSNGLDIGIKHSF